MSMGALVAWQSKLQPTIAPSTTEAEYQVAATTIKETLWMRNLLKQLLEPKSIKVNILIDNQSALRLLKNPQSVTQAKHIDVQHHFIRERAMRKEIDMMYYPTESMWADYLTKPIPAPKFKECIQTLGMILPRIMPSGSVGKNGLSQENSPIQDKIGDPPKRSSLELETESPTPTTGATPSQNSPEQDKNDK